MLQRAWDTALSCRVELNHTRGATSVQSRHRRKLPQAERLAPMLKSPVGAGLTYRRSTLVAIVVRLSLRRTAHHLAIRPSDVDGLQLATRRVAPDRELDVLALVERTELLGFCADT